MTTFDGERIMASGISRYLLSRRPTTGNPTWTPGGQLALQIERAGVSADLVEVGWLAQDGAEASLTLPGHVGTYRSPDGKVWALRGEPAPDQTVECATPASYLLFEGDDEQHPQNPLRVLLDGGGEWPARLSWRLANGESGHAVFAPPLQDGRTAKVADIQATAENLGHGEVAANLIDGSATTKWSAPVACAELALRLSTDSAVVHYDLDSAGDAPDRDPRDWQLLGMHDGRWVVLDERRGEHFDDRLTSRRFTVAVPRPCTRYRLRITGNAGSAHLQLGGLRLHTADGPEPPPSFLGWYRRPGAEAVPLRGFLTRRRSAGVRPAPEPPTVRSAKAAVPTPQLWREWIADYSLQWFGTAGEKEIEDAALPATGLSTPTAGLTAVLQTEARLGIRLPPSLRSFYQATDGLREAGSFGERVLPLAELTWMREEEAELISFIDLGGEGDAFTDLLARMLRIGVNSEGTDYLLLDPRDCTNGEWAAYTWRPRADFHLERYGDFAAMLDSERELLEEFRAHEGRPAHPEKADELTAEGRRLALAGDVTAAHETLNRAMVAGSAVAAYLDAQVRLFAFPDDWHESTLRNGVLGKDHVMAAIDDIHLRGDLLPMFLALALRDRVGPSVPFVQRLAGYSSRIDALPGRPVDPHDEQGWAAFAASLVTDPLPDPDPFGWVCGVARELVRLGRPDDAWTVLRGALESWLPDSPLRVMPVILISDPVLRTIMTPERRLIAAVARSHP